MNNNPLFVCFILTVIVVSLLLLGAGLSLPSQAAPVPAPSLNKALASVSDSVSPSSAGGLIELHVQFPNAWTEVRWQELWTVVEWQDDKGEWRTVERWQGSLDDVSITDGDLVWGKKMWWVADGDLGKGPFRWAVYQDKEGRLLGRSEVFYLPDSTHAIEHVEIIPRLP